MSFQYTEYTQRISYADIINRQLDRIARLRTNIHKYREKLSFPYFMLAREYISAVETLYVILLPELRGEAGKYIHLAKKNLSLRIERIKLEEKLEDHKHVKEIYEILSRHGGKSEGFEELDEDEAKLVKRMLEIDKELNELIKQLPEKYRIISSGYTDYEGLFVFPFLDAALEEMLVRLNQAGLLIQGKPITIGVPSVPSGSNKESI